MPNLKSAKKRLRQNARRLEINKATKTRVKSARAAFRASLDGDDESAKKAAYATFCASLDKAVKSGVIARNNAIRNKTRAANALRGGKAAPVAYVSRERTEVLDPTVESSEELQETTGEVEPGAEEEVTD